MIIYTGSGQTWINGERREVPYELRYDITRRVHRVKRKRGAGEDMESVGFKAFTGADDHCSRQYRTSPDIWTQLQNEASQRGVL